MLKRLQEVAFSFFLKLNVASSELLLCNLYNDKQSYIARILYSLSMGNKKS
jgi:hypothetical protein